MYDRLFTKAGLSLERLSSFARLVEARGFIAAAKGDPNRQSQFSRQLKELEEYFGVELVKRGRGKFTLTSAGEALHRIVLSHFTALEDFSQTCAGQPVELSIGAGESLIHWLLLPRLGRMRQALPHCRFILKNLRTDEIVEQLAVGRTDFGLVRRSAIGKSLKSAPLAPMEYALFVPRSLCPALRKKRLDGFLDGLPIALLEGGGSIERILREEAESSGVKLNVVVECSSYTQAADVVQRLEAAAILPVVARQAFDEEVIEQIDLPFLHRLRRPMVLAWNPRQAGIRPNLAKAADVLLRLLA